MGRSTADDGRPGARALSGARRPGPRGTCTHHSFRHPLCSASDRQSLWRMCGVRYTEADMSTVEEIKSAIDKLSLEDRAQLERMLHGWVDDEWDRQIAADAAAGR